MHHVPHPLQQRAEVETEPISAAAPYNSLVFTPEGLRHLAAEVGTSQIVIGTDYPFPWTKTAVDQILDAPSLSDGDRAAILGENAVQLLSISA